MCELVYRGWRERRLLTLCWVPKCTGGMRLRRCVLGMEEGGRGENRGEGVLGALSATNRASSSSNVSGLDLALGVAGTGVKDCEE